jgi:hypothetical protein
MVESVYCLKQFTTGSRNCHLGGKRFADDEGIEMEALRFISICDLFTDPSSYFF